MSIGVGDDFVGAATKTGLWEAKSLFVVELSAIRRLTADWLRKPVADTANNWVTVQEARNGRFLAAVGKETFDVRFVWTWQMAKSRPPAWITKSKRSST